jgi:hypothetical protein
MHRVDGPCSYCGALITGDLRRPARTASPRRLRDSWLSRCKDCLRNPYRSARRRDQFGNAALGNAGPIWAPFGLTGPRPQNSPRQAYVDCHRAAVLAVAQASRYLPDPRLVAAIERGLSSYCLETAAIAREASHRDHPHQEGGCWLARHFVESDLELDQNAAKGL